VNSRCFYVAVAVFLCQLSASIACADVATPPAQFTAEQKRNVGAIVSALKRATRQAAESDDWKGMAGLYPKQALSCWDASGEDHAYSFLSMEAIPENATFEVSLMDKWYVNGMNFSAGLPTHLLRVSYETTALEGCASNSNRWPKRDFYLRQVGSSFELVHDCPSDDIVKAHEVRKRYPLVSNKHAKQIANEMSPSERQSIRDSIRADPFVLTLANKLQSRYQVGESEAYFIMDAVCSRKD
jgi:hypothetical protein